MTNPIATYRIQFHKDFTFSHFERIIPYLDKLGIKTVYASPIFEAVAGSQHGYDVVNPQRINPEIGTQAQLTRIHQQLRERGIGWLQPEAWLQQYVNIGSDQLTLHKVNLKYE